MQSSWYLAIRLERIWLNGLDHSLVPGELVQGAAYRSSNVSFIYAHAILGGESDWIDSDCVHVRAGVGVNVLMWAIDRNMAGLLPR